MAEPSIILRGVNKSFGATHAVRDLDLEVPCGSVCGFLGPNGAGKTTAIRMIMSIIYPDRGGVEVLGGNALRSKDRIGYLPEERGLYRKMRVGEFLEYMARLKGVRDRNLEQRITLWLERLDLPNVFNKRCEELSKGMQQKVQFLVAVLHDPELLILDEPFSGLDPVNTDLLRTLIQDLNTQGKTIIFSTHVLHQAEQICDRIFLINHGEKLLDASMDEIHRKFDPRTIRAEPLEGTLEGEQFEGVEHVCRLHDDGVYELHLHTDADPQAVLREVLSRHQMRAIELRRLSLEEVFVQLVGRGQGDDAAQQAREELSHV